MAEMTEPEPAGMTEARLTELETNLNEWDDPGEVMELCREVRKLWKLRDNLAAMLDFLESWTNRSG